MVCVHKVETRSFFVVVLFTNTRTHLYVQKTTRKKNVCYFLVPSHLMWSVVQLIRSGITLCFHGVVFFFCLLQMFEYDQLRSIYGQLYFIGGRGVSGYVVVQPMQKMLAMTPNDREKERVRTLWDDSY